MNNQELRSSYRDHSDEPSPASEAARFWEHHYGQRDQVWSGNPNPQLLREVTAVTPGTALDVGCVEGADAIWLAERGWQITTVDISTVAIARGAARAVELGATIGRALT